MITELTNVQKLAFITEAIDFVTHNTEDPWGDSIYTFKRKRTNNYDIGDFGEYLVCSLLKEDGEDAEIYKSDGLDIKRGNFQDEVKTASLNINGCHWFNQIKFSDDKTSGVSFDYLYFVGIFPDNSCKIWRAKNSEELKATFKWNNTWSWKNKFPEKLDNTLWECYFEYIPDGEEE
jgi:hypothetical protein